MHAWIPSYGHNLFTPCDLYVPAFLSGKFTRQVPDMNKGMISIGYGQVAFMAAEMGDQNSRQKLLAYAEADFIRCGRTAPTTIRAVMTSKLMRGRQFPRRELLDGERPPPPCAFGQRRRLLSPLS